MKKRNQQVLDRAIKTAEKNLASGNWKVETARLYIKGAVEQPEKYPCGGRKEKQIKDCG